MMAQDRLLLVPTSLREANAFVELHHRHHGPTRGHKFAVAVGSTDGVLRGVAIAGRPVARLLDDGVSLEVLRVCTDGTPNVCSKLYSAVRRAAVAMGYPAHRIYTYTLASEPGTSLRAAGWVRDADTKGGEWGRTDRPRDTHNAEPKVRWRAAAPRHVPPASTVCDSEFGGRHYFAIDGACQRCGHPSTPPESRTPDVIP